MSDSIQTPSLRIGSNQVIGFVQIESDEKSELIEKSARDGLRENTAFGHLKEIAQRIIADPGISTLSLPTECSTNETIDKPLNRELDALFSYDESETGCAADSVQRLVWQLRLPRMYSRFVGIGMNRNGIEPLVTIQQAVAIYQGQATLRLKIINVILHEGRRPLSYFRNAIPNLLFWLEHTDSWKTTQMMTSIGS